MHSPILPSRAALVDRIELQFEYGQNLISLVGEAGLGKSYLLETFVTDKYESFNKAYIKLSASLSDVDLMTQLLEHSFPRPLVDQTQSLSENFYRLAKEHSSVQCIWVLDGVRHLSEEMCEQLSLLASRSPLTLYILAASQSAGVFRNAVELHLEPLSERESLQLMSWFYRDLPPIDDPVFRAFIESAHGNPALLLSWDSSHSAELKAATPVSWRMHLLGGGLLILLVLAGLLYQGTIRLPGAEPESTENVSPEPQLALQQEETEVASTSQEVASSGGAEPEIAEEKRVNTAEIAAALEETSIDAAPPMATPANVPEGDKLDESVTTKSEVEVAPVEAIAVEPPQTPPAKNEVREDENTSPAELAPVFEVEDNAWFAAQADGSVVLQLIGLADVGYLDDFLTDHGLHREQVKVYKALRQGRPWYGVTYGNYANADEARSAQEHLPEALKKGQPFIKTIRKIKQEIALNSKQ